MDLIIQIISFATACAVYLAAVAKLISTVIETVSKIRGRSGGENEGRQD